MRRRFLRKFVLVLVVFFVGLFAAFKLLSEAFGIEGRQRGALFIGLWIAVFVLMSLLGRASFRFARPVADLIEGAQRLASGESVPRVRERGPGQVRQLVRTFNRMSERLETEEGRRRQLLADVAHELRTPLSVIQANLEAFIDGLYPTDEEHLRSVLEETKTMSRLLNDLQTLSTAEAGALTLHRESTAARDLVDAAVRSFAAQASDAGVRLETRVADGLPEIDVDRLRIGEVLSNLLSNAIRHTPAGGVVTLSAGAAGSKEAKGLELSVSDTGSGIPSERLPHVFDRFSRTPDSPGAGLGLAIARSLVEAHGGRIRAESGEGGTTITFFLPG